MDTNLSRSKVYERSFNQLIPSFFEDIPPIVSIGLKVSRILHQRMLATTNFLALLHHLLTEGTLQRHPRRNTALNQRISSTLQKVGLKHAAIFDVLRVYSVA